MLDSLPYFCELACGLFHIFFYDLRIMPYVDCCQAAWGNFWEKYFRFPPWNWSKNFKCTKQLRHCPLNVLLVRPFHCCLQHLCKVNCVLGIPNNDICFTHIEFNEKISFMTDVSSLFGIASFCHISAASIKKITHVIFLVLCFYFRTPKSLSSFVEKSI